MIKLVVFDLDDTLYPEKDYILSGYKRVAELLQKKYHLDIPLDYFFEAFNNGNRHRVFNYVLEKLNIHYENDFIQSLINHYRNHNPEISLSESVRQVLKDLKKTKKLSLISDGYLNAQKLKIKALKIEKYFDKIYLTDKTGKKDWKPSLYYFKKCQNYFKFTSDSIVYIGDNWQKDFYPGNILGWKTISLENNTKLYINKNVEINFQPKKTIYNLSEIFNLL